MEILGTRKQFYGDSRTVEIPVEKLINLVSAGAAAEISRIKDCVRLSDNCKLIDGDKLGVVMFIDSPSANLFSPIYMSGLGWFDAGATIFNAERTGAFLAAILGRISRRTLQYTGLIELNG